MTRPKQIIDEIRKNPKIPAPSQTVFRVLSMTRDPNSDTRQVATVISRDAALTAELLHQANSALYGGTTATSSVTAACVRLGIKRVRAAVINQHIVRGLSKVCPQGFNPQHYWQSALAISVASSELARSILQQSAEEAGTAGLLCDIGIGLFAFGIPTEYGPVMAEWKESHATSLSAIEERRLGLTHAQIGAAILKDWGLDASILDAVEHHHWDPLSETEKELPKFTRIVCAAVTLSQIALDGSDMDRVARLFAQVEALTPKADDLVTKMLDTLVAQLQATAKMLSVELGSTETMESNFADALRDIPEIIGDIATRPTART